MASEAAARGRTRFATFCWFALAYTLAVIVWGAFVRATGSGAGCGSHWPTCNGEVVPRAPSVETLIEFSHRLTSGLSGLIVLAQVLLARRLYPRGHRVRQAAGWAGGFMLLEVIIGAGIVVLKYVADDQSVGRAVWMGVHLVSTFLLVGAMTLTAHYARGAARVRLAGTGTRGALAGVVLASIILTGLSGSVAALGDTLFPAESLGTALAADLSPTAMKGWATRRRTRKCAVGDRSAARVVPRLSAGKSVSPNAATEPLSPVRMIDARTTPA
ncbi:MAG: COX15/CtaA family protein, partial [Myxococcota bacterium]